MPLNKVSGSFLRSNSNKYLVVLFLAAFSGCGTEDENWTPEIKAIEEALDREISLPLVELLGPGRHCVFPTGTVAPHGEVAHIYGSRKIEFMTHHNSHDYWFVVKDGANHIVLIYPIRDKNHHLLNNEIVCGHGVRLVRDGNSLKATAGG